MQVQGCAIKTHKMAWRKINVLQVFTHNFAVKLHVKKLPVSVFYWRHNFSKENDAYFK